MTRIELKATTWDASELFFVSPDGGLELIFDQLAKDEDFKESDHPRDVDGKFGSGGGGSKGQGEGEHEEESAPEGSEQEAKEQRELVQSFYDDSPGDVVDVINGAELDDNVQDKISSIESLTSDLADVLESLQEDVDGITDEDRAGLKEGEVFTAEEEFEEQATEAAGQASTAREELVEAANTLAEVLGLDDITIPDDIDIDELTPEEARAVAEAVASIDIQNSYVTDAASDLENAMDDDDETMDSCVTLAQEFKKKATALHDAIKVAIYKIDVATEAARKRTKEEAEKAVEAFEKRQAAAGAKDHALAFDRAIFSNAGAEILRPGLAFDRGTVRAYDVDGRLRIEVANISKANICPYVGSEIPGWEELGLDKKKIYHLFRDPEELEKAAPTFNNLPLLSKHVAVTADDHQPDLVIGATGSDAVFVAPFLKNSLVIWAKSAIAGVENDEKKELSSAYHYRVDMTPGTSEGARYDGAMRDIVGNHVCLVKEGRAGTDVVVGDSAIEIGDEAMVKPGDKVHAGKPGTEDFDRGTVDKVEGSKAFVRWQSGVSTWTPISDLAMDSKGNTMASKRKTTIRTVLTIGAVSAFLQPRLKKDAGKISFDHALDGLTSTNFSARKTAIIDAVTKATKGKLAHDASIDGLAQVLEMIEGGKGGSADADPMVPKKDDDDKDDGVPGNDAEGLPGFLKGKLSADDYTKCMDMMKSSKDAEPSKIEEIDASGDAEKDGEKKEDEEEPGKDAAGPDGFKGKPEVGGGSVTKKAMDEAIKTAVKVATDTATKTQRAIREAESAVRPWVGELAVAFDSGEAVFRHALTMLGVEHKDVHATALKHILDVQPRPGPRAHMGGGAPAVAMDAATTDDFTKRFPEAARLRQ